MAFSLSAQLARFKHKSARRFTALHHTPAMGLAELTKEASSLDIHSMSTVAEEKRLKENAKKPKKRERPIKRPD